MSQQVTVDAPGTYAWARGTLQYAVERQGVADTNTAALAAAGTILIVDDADDALFDALGATVCLVLSGPPGIIDNYVRLDAVSPVGDTVNDAAVAAGKASGTAVVDDVAYITATAPPSSGGGWLLVVVAIALAVLSSCVPAAIAFQDGTQIAICTTAQTSKAISTFQATKARSSGAADVISDVMDWLNVALSEVGCITPPALDLARQAKAAKGVKVAK